MLQYLRYRYAKSQMTAYINDELSQRARRYVARQIERDPRCEAEYRRQRSLKDTVERTLPVMGRPDATQLNNMWLNIQSQMSDNTAVVPTSRHTPAAHFSLGYALAIILCLLGLLLPFSFKVEGSESITAAQQPVPQIQAQISVTPFQAATTSETSMIAIARWTEPGSTPMPANALHNTPSPYTPEK